MNETETPEEPFDPQPEPEPEQPDDDDDEAADDDERNERLAREDDAPHGPSAEVLEERRKKAEQAFRAYTKKIGTIFEEEATNLFECPLCPEQHKGFLNLQDAGRIPPEVTATVQTFLGVVQEADYLQDPDVTRCSRCGGRGRTKTDSLVPDWKTLPCKACSARGYVGPPDAAGSPPLSVTVTGDATLTPVPNGPQPDADAWGSPRLLPDGMENPNYGRMPQYKTPAYP